MSGQDTALESGRATRFTHAITRRPGPGVTDGLRAVDTGAPDLARMLAQHDAYLAALRGAGVEVIVLDPLEGFPDALFVEDTALCLPELAVILAPGAPSRRGEAAAMAPHLRALYGEVAEVTGPGSVEGGDILTTGREVIVGLSARTDAAGVEALARQLAPLALPLRVVETPPGVLHFKTDCALLDEETVLCTARLAASGCFAGYRVIPVAEGEEAGANAVRVNAVVLVPEGFPRTAAALDHAGFDLRVLGNSECGKLDGGMSCLSLRFSPPAAAARGFDSARPGL